MISRESTNIATIQYLSATTTSVRISSKISSCLEVQPSLRAWESACGKNFTNWPLRLTKSRSWPLPSVNTRCGLVVLSSPPSQPSRLCGSISRNTTRMVHRSFIESASEQAAFLILYRCIKINYYFSIYTPFIFNYTYLS